MNQHPNKHIREAVGYALRRGWTLREAGGHAERDDAHARRIGRARSGERIADAQAAEVEAIVQILAVEHGSTTSARSFDNQRIPEGELAAGMAIQNGQPRSRVSMPEV